MDIDISRTKTFRHFLLRSLIAALLLLAVVGDVFADAIGWESCVDILNMTQAKMKLDASGTGAIDTSQWKNPDLYEGPAKEIAINKFAKICAAAPPYFNIHYWVTYSIYNSQDTKIGTCKVESDQAYLEVVVKNKLKKPSVTCSNPGALHSAISKRNNRLVSIFNSGLSGCPAPLQKTGLYQVINYSDKEMTVTDLWGYKSGSEWDKFPAKAYEFLGSKNYKLAVSKTLIAPKESFYVQTCADSSHVTQKDGSMDLFYYLKSTKTNKAEPGIAITFSGSGVPDQNNRKHWYVRNTPKNQLGMEIPWIIIR